MSNRKPKASVLESNAESTVVTADDLATETAAQRDSLASESRNANSGPLDDPFEFKTLAAGGNKVRYGVSHKVRAYFLLFDNNPNQDREAGDAHPVIDKLKADGWQWRATPSGVRAWKKSWESPEYRFAEDQRMREYAGAIADELAGHAEGRSL